MSTENRKLFGEKFSKLLNDSSLSVPNFSEKIGEPERTIRLWSRGKNIPRPHKLKKIAEFFNVSPNFFFANSNVSELPRLNKVPGVSWATAARPR